MDNNYAITDTQAFKTIENTLKMNGNRQKKNK